MVLVEEYINSLYLRDELMELSEMDFQKILQKISPKEKLIKILRGVASAAKEKDMVEIKKIVDRVGLKNIKPKTLDTMGEKLSEDYKGKKDLASRIIRNSLGSSKKVSDFAGSVVAVGSTMKFSKNDNMDERRKMKGLIKDIVERGRKFYDDISEPPDTEEKKSNLTPESIADIAVAIAIIVTFGILIAALLPYVIGPISSIAATAGGIATAVSGIVGTASATASWLIINIPRLIFMLAGIACGILILGRLK
jgi:hypothetical protein